ncbi:hypothetical protein [Plantactinospora sp. GCM10030261]|uniref:hypothetical protein n=1 Tax=Plantactinospora sp. GCM10030261 TaxID=3273420 RepID=UPI003610A7E5
MVVPDSVSVTAPAWRPGDWWSAAFRMCLLLVLSAGAVAVVTSVRPAERPESDLIADLAAGRVTHLDYQRGSHTVRWANGWWRWRATTMVSWRESVDLRSTRDPQSDAALEWLDRQVVESGHPVQTRIRADHEPRWWPAEVVWEPLRAATVAAWFGTFLVMLGGARHRYANRWAWFWLFTVGQAGALLYLILEPQPVWRPRSWQARTDRALVGGGTGLIWAVLLSITVSLVAAGASAL